MTQRRSVLVREDRLVQRVEQRHEALGAVGQRPGRYRQPRSDIHAATPLSVRKQASRSNSRRRRARSVA